jgi:hypothetical protein
LFAAIVAAGLVVYLIHLFIPRRQRASRNGLLPRSDGQEQPQTSISHDGIRMQTFPTDGGTPTHDRDGRERLVMRRMAGRAYVYD